ncbi:MAG: ABC transporter ATP-binding protein [Acidimicrobiales bacterium]
MIGSGATTPVIETHALTKRFGSLTAVDHVDLRVEVGEVFGFLGPNGAGKSTLIRLVLDLIRPTSGSVRVFGLDSRDDAARIHRRIGLAPSEPALPRDLTAERYLAFRDDLRGIDTRARRAELADRLGADLRRRIGEMSTGNQQKVALIQALAHEPELIVLDEPSRGLDPLVQHALHEILRASAESGATVFLSSHSLAEVDRTADRVGIIRDGHLVTVEALAEVKAKVAHTVELELTGPAEEDWFDYVDNIDEVHVSGTHVTARVRGSVDAFLRVAIDRSGVRRVRSSEGDLEDVFLGFYRSEADE